MSEPKKAAPKAIADVAHPGKSAPSDTSKPIITHRPMMKDPMVVEDSDKPEDTPKKPLSKQGETKIEPPKSTEETDSPKPEKKSQPAGTLVPKDTDEKTGEKPDEPKTEPKTEPKDEAEDKPESKTDKPDETGGNAPADEDEDKPDSDKSDTDKDKKAKQPEDEAKAAAQAEQDTKLQKIVDSKKYFLPINAVEQRRSKRFVVLGIFLAIILALAWADVALDAGLVKIGNIKPVTHFFSN